MKFLSIEEVLRTHESVILQYGGMNGLRSLELLESALARPINALHYDPESNIFRLAALYTVGIALNHAFVDGNKRTAFLASVVFLARNGYSLDVDNELAAIMVNNVAMHMVSDSDYEVWLRLNSTMIE